MSHTVRDKKKLLNRVRRLRGQVEAIERALENESGCERVLQLIAASRGAMNALMAVVIEDHIRMHIVDPAKRPDSARSQGAAELIDVVHSYFK